MRVLPESFQVFIPVLVVKKKNHTSAHKPSINIKKNQINNFFFLDFSDAVETFPVKLQRISYSFELHAEQLGSKLRMLFYLKEI